MDNTTERFAGQSYELMLTLTAIIHKRKTYTFPCTMRSGQANQGKTIEEAAANLREATPSSIWWSS